MKWIRTIVVSMVLSAFVLGYADTAAAQQSPPPENKNSAASVRPIPILPFIAEYEFAPVYFMQWINDSKQYSRIAASVGSEKPPVYLVVLTEKESNRPVYYTNSAPRAKALKTEGKEAYHTPIDFKEVREVEKPPTIGIGFRDRNGQAIIWRFIPANSTPSKRGGGLQPLAAMVGLHFRFSDLGTAAGAGTAVQIGDKVHEAEPWPQISAPPYFVAHRGSYAHGMELSAMLLGTENWRLRKAANELNEGEQWSLVSDYGRERELQITKRSGDEITISEKAAPGIDSATLEFNALLTPEGLALRAVILKSRAHAMRVSFTPELNLLAQTPAAGIESTYQIDLGTHEKVSQGVVIVVKQDKVVNLIWRPKTPDWAKSRSLTSVINLTASGYSIEVTQPK